MPVKSHGKHDLGVDLRLPLLVGIGVHPHFGARRSIRDVMAETIHKTATIPFAVIMLLVLILLIAYPQLSLILT